MWKKIINQEVYIVSHIICKATAADSFKTGEAESISLSSSPQKKEKQNQTKKQLERLFCWTNRENENWRACLLFKFKGSCSFQGTKPVNTLFSSDLKIHSRNSVFKLLIFRRGMMFGYVFTYFSTFATCLYTNWQSLLYNSSYCFKTFQWEHIQCFHCTLPYNTWSKCSAAIFPWCDLHNKRSASTEITVTTAVADEKQWSCFIK